MRIKLVLLSIALFIGFSILTAQESEDVKKKFTDARVLTEEKTENVSTELRIPDTSAYMNRKRTDISDNYQNFLLDRLKKSNQLLYK